MTIDEIFIAVHGTEISQAIQDSLVKMGINVEVRLETRKIKGVKTLYVETSRYNTTPVLFRSIHLYGWGYVEGCDGVHDIFVPLNFRYELFKGGENGAELGCAHFRLFDDTERIAYLGLTI